MELSRSLVPAPASSLTSTSSLTPIEAPIDLKIFPNIKSRAQAVLVKQIADSLGVSYSAVASSITFVKGKMTFGYTFLAGLIRRSGNYTYVVDEMNDRVCTITFRMKVGNEWMPCGVPRSFTIEDAKRAGLLGSEAWKKYPSTMLFARALTSGMRIYCPDVTLGMPAYCHGELDAVEDVSPPPRIDSNSTEVDEEAEDSVGYTTTEMQVPSSSSADEERVPDPDYDWFTPFADSQKAFKTACTVAGFNVTQAPYATESQKRIVTNLMKEVIR
jgi:hypothetical protein